MAWPSRPSFGTVLFILFSLLCVGYVLRFAWVAEDAYITFRVVDNVLNGHGLRWNVDERVQVYSHPLWLLLHVAGSLVVGNIYRLTIMLSAACGVGAVVLLCRMAPASRWHQALLVIAPLTLSRTFGDWVISGLENPLSFLLIAWLLWEWFKPEDRFRLFRVVFIASLCLLTRWDNAVIIAPALAWTAWRYRRRVVAWPTVVACSPLLAWSAFSMVYYGFLFPNTKYAKLNTGIPVSEYVAQGRHYLSSFVSYDFLGFVLVTSALAIGMFRLLVMGARRKVTPDEVRPAILALGCAAQVAYVLWVGGDFMNGRFLSTAVVVAVAVVFDTCRQWPPVRTLAPLSALVVVAAADTFIVRPSVAEPYDFNAHHGINNEREYYSPSTGLFSDPARRFRLHPAGLQSAVVDEYGRMIPYVMGAIDEPGTCAPLALDRFAANGVGLLGYCSGPGVTIIDTMALTDPLLARLPIADPAHWRIGHFLRAIPPGYWQAIRTGDTSGMDPALAARWGTLRLVTSGDLWDVRRLRAIAGVQ